MLDFYLRSYGSSGAFGELLCLTLLTKSATHSKQQRQSDARLTLFRFSQGLKPMATAAEVTAAHVAGKALARQREVLDDCGNQVKLALASYARHAMDARADSYVALGEVTLNTAGSYDTSIREAIVEFCIQNEALVERDEVVMYRTFAVLANSVIIPFSLFDSVLDGTKCLGVYSPF